MSDLWWLLFEIIAYGGAALGPQREGTPYEGAPDVCQACGVRPAHKGLKKRGYQFCFRCALDARERYRLGASLCLAGVLLAGIVAVVVFFTAEPGDAIARIYLWCLVAAMVVLGGVSWRLWSAAPYLRSVRVQQTNA